ncbi:hypothetical protein SanaruYs_20210 [Chryseotalea sanaruensis]|uniref:Uncharacterized protein n=2 Tax=Chryseotalea sanaruensis TaxID=2482724 RepID=A0A401UA93_9BACT|nr:hypothetical protein SanaruYs_20210 [Chryseotalea sanaruensis]
MVPIETLLIEEKSTEIKRRVFSDSLLQLNTNQVEDAFQLENHHFGDFFCDRASFYVIDEPANTFYSKEASSITLFYIDGALRQTKYLLKDDISGDLIRSYGNFKIAGFDDKNKQLIKARSILKKSYHGVIIEPALDNYELRWVFNDREIKYRVKRVGEEVEFKFVERVKNFEKEFSSIEKMCS